MVSSGVVLKTRIQPQPPRAGLPPSSSSTMVMDACYPEQARDVSNPMGTSDPKV
jgi:hypothetical protein